MLHFLSCTLGSGNILQYLKHICAPGWFVRMANNNATSTQYKILRTFEAEILKVFKKIQPQPRKLDVLIKKKRVYEYIS